MQRLRPWAAFFFLTWIFLNGALELTAQGLATAMRSSRERGIVFVFASDFGLTGHRCCTGAEVCHCAIDEGKDLPDCAINARQDRPGMIILGTVVPASFQFVFTVPMLDAMRLVYTAIIELWSGFPTEKTALGHSRLDIPPPRF